MAINPSNSNIISITQLPAAQLAVGSDNLILQTTNGTQTITFDRFNVVKTDIAGNASVIGTLSAPSASFPQALINTLTAANIVTTGGTGVTLPTDFYNKWTIQNGLVLSASQDIKNDPLYVQLTTQDIPTYVAKQLTNVRYVVDLKGTVTLPAGQSTVNVFIDRFFSTPPNNSISISDITPAHINLTSNIILSAIPIVPSYSITYGQSTDNNYDALVFQINAGNTFAIDVTFYWRLLLTVPAVYSA
jgi:hypothetical protein